jgi:4-hydroxy-tetrahydrodipicolinate synthase
MVEKTWLGTFAATLCAFNADYSLDEHGLREYARYLAGVEGLKGVVCNGHTGDVMGLRATERARVTRIFAEECGRKMKIVSGVCTEGSFEAIDHALAAKEAGADAILLMPPHHWLRFGRTPTTAVNFFNDVARGADLPIIVHQYPAWTKASYSLDDMIAMTKIPQVVAIKMGTRDMSRAYHDYKILKQVAPHIPILTCHDEYLLESLLAGSDGALVGFAGFVPELIIAMVTAAVAGDLQEARRIQESVYPLAKMVYRFGEPSGDAHQRMKVAMCMQGRFPSMTVRPPLPPLSEMEMARVRAEVEANPYVHDRRTRAM